MNTRSVYLDLNHFIDLAKRRKSGNLEIERRLLALVDIGHIAVPISAVHIMEVAAITSATQRTDLGSMMKALSRGLAIRSIEQVRFLEVANPLAIHYGLPDRVRPIAEFVLARGYHHAFGELAIDFTPWRVGSSPAESSKAEGLMWQALLDPSLLDEMLAKHRPKIGQQTPEHNDLKKALEGMRREVAGKSINVIEEECVLGLRKDFVHMAVESVKELGLSDSQLREDPPVQFWTKQFMATLPTYSVWAKLHAYLAKSFQGEMKVNHLYDFAHLAVAIPYCDVVVIDKEMAHLVTSRKLDSEYGTDVFTDLEHAVEWLESNA
jgi:hypothetical protein